MASKANGGLDGDARFVKYFACNVARLGAGRDIGTDLAVWTGVAPAFPPADRLSTASAALPLHQPTMAAPSHASRLSCAVVDGRVASRPQSDCKHPPATSNILPCQQSARSLPTDCLQHPVDARFLRKLTAVNTCCGRGFIFQTATNTQSPNSYRLGLFCPFPQ